MRKRAKFNLSNFHNCTFKMGYLYPVNLTEVLPGDSVQLSTSVFLRLAPMVVPVMHPVYMHLSNFFVPSRILWDGFEDFITGGPDGTDTSVLPKVTLNVTNSPVGSLADAFGIPVQMLKDAKTFSVNSLPFIAYYMIWNEYFRDQDLNEAIDLSTITGTPSSLSLLRPSWAKDYFTTARPWPQKGPDVSVPVNLTDAGAPTITGTVVPNGVPTFGVQDSGAPVNPQNALYVSSQNEGNVNYNSYSRTTLLNWQDPALKVNIDYTSGNPELGSVNINDLREAFALQRFEEHRSMFGSRYEDLLRYLGVRPQDARLQLPEYLGGFSAPVQFSEVLQTSSDAERSGVGDMYGHGIGATKGRRIRRFIPEHGYVMSLLTVRPIPVYSQGLERLWSKENRFDFWQKEYEHIGQQEICNSEVYADGDTAQDKATFGYQNRYDEYRRGVNVITGEFRTNQDYWTMARIFASRPTLNGDFVSCMPTDRIFQVNEQNSDQCYAMVKNNIIAKRLVSKNGNPM
nr:MAG TPA: Major capsid protein [Microviridae sp.]